jgi:hypothetical protein
MYLRAMQTLQLSDTLITALSRLVDDGQTEVKREPTHSTLTFHFQQARVSQGDPAEAGQPVGKAKRVRAVLSWAMEHAPEAGGRLAVSLVSVVKGYGGFRESSPNFVGADVITDAIEACRTDGYVLTHDGELRPLLLDSLSGRELSDALTAYVRRAKRGTADAALVTGTGKDLLEATAKHVLVTKYSAEPTITNFPTLLAQAFMALGLNITRDQAKTAQQRLDAALYELACAVNALRNAEGTGHGRPFPATVSDLEARAAVESMGVVAERLLALL